MDKNIKTQRTQSVTQRDTKDFSDSPWTRTNSYQGLFGKPSSIFVNQSGTVRMYVTIS